MLTLSKEWNVSLDYLTGNEGFVDKPQKSNMSVSGKIMIKVHEPPNSTKKTVVVAAV